MHHCLKKKKTEEVGMMIQVEYDEKDEDGTTVPQLHKGAKKVTFKFPEWMTRNNMGAENAIKCYVVQGKGFLIHCEEINPSYIADNWLCPVGMKILLPMPLENHLFPEGTIHSRQNPYSGFQKFIEFQTYRFYTFYLIDPKFSNKEKYLFKQNFDSVHARLHQKRKKLFKESVVLTMKNQSEKMSNKKNLKFNTAIMISFIQKLRCLSPSLDWMTDVLTKNFPDEFSLESFKGFTSGAFRKTWASVGGDNLDDTALKEAGPK